VSCAAAISSAAALPLQKTLTDASSESSSGNCERVRTSLIKAARAGAQLRGWLA
jgi:hypothetical protein